MEKMKAQSAFFSKVVTVFWILVNVWSVVGLVFINKSIFSKYANTGVTVTLSHMYSTCIALTGANLVGVVKAKPIPFLKIFPLALLNSSAIVFSNLALHHSPVTVYQIFKVMITPCVAFLQAIFWPASISLSLLFCLIIITVGGLVTVTSPSHIHLSFASLGGNFSAMFISALFQIITAKKMKDLKTSPNELLFYQAPMNVLIMFVFLLMFEADSFKTVVSDHSYLKVVFIGSLLAPIINLSTTQVIHRTSPIMYSVVSQLKSVIIILFSIIFLHEHPSNRSIIGLGVLVVGVVLYVTKSNNSKPLNKSSEIIFSPTMTTTTTITITSSPAVPAAPSPTLNNTPLALRLSQHMGSEMESQQECQYSIFNWNHAFIFFALITPAFVLSILPANSVQNVHT